MGNYLDLDNLNSYKIALNLSNYVWKIVLTWNYFAKDTVGKQFVRAVDSISANIAEGFGRYTKKDKINFYRLRKLLNDEQYNYILTELNKLPREINSLIKYTNEKLSI